MRRNLKVSSKNNSNVDNENNIDNEFNKSLEILENYKEDVKEIREERLNGYKVKYKYFIYVILSIIFLVLIYLFFEYSTIIGFNLSKKTEYKFVKINDIMYENNEYYNYNNEFLVYYDNTIRTYNNSAKKTWEYKLEKNFIPNIYIKDKYMVVSNNSTGNVYLFESKNEVTNKKIDGKISNIFIDNNGNIAVEYSTSGYKKIVTVFDKYGKDKYSAYIDASSIIDISMQNNASKLIITQVVANSLTIGTKISVIDINKNDKIEEIFKLDNSYIFNNKVYNEDYVAVLNDRIDKYNLSNLETKNLIKLNLNQTNFIALSDNYYTIIEMENEKYKLINNKFDNTNISEYILESIPKYIKNTGLLTYIVNENNLIVVNKWGVQVANIKIDYSPKDIIVFDNEKSVALIYSDKIEIVRL
jgi:hypothetical protein